MSEGRKGVASANYPAGIKTEPVFVTIKSSAATLLPLMPEAIHVMLQPLTKDLKFLGMQDTDGVGDGIPEITEYISICNAHAAGLSATSGYHLITATEESPTFACAKANFIKLQSVSASQTVAVTHWLGEKRNRNG